MTTTTEPPATGRPSPTTSTTPAAPTGTVANEPRWLTAEQQRAWRSYLAGSARLTEALNRQLEDEADLSLSEYEILVRLSESPDRAVRMSELADSLVQSRSRVTHTVARLERRGLVTRRSCSDDGRGVEAALTETGFATLVDAAPGHVRAVRAALVDPLTAEQFRALGEAMARVALPDGE